MKKVIMFSAQWCGPCKAMKPMFDKAAKKVEDENIEMEFHVFDIEGIARRMWQFSESSSFGVGVGMSSALWYRALTNNSPYEETLFLPSLILETGFEFNPMMVQLKWMVNRLGSDSSINGIEFMFGIRL